MSDNKRNRRSFTGKGYYIALILCAAAIGISGYLYQKNNQEAVKEVGETEPLIVIMEPTPEDVPVIAPRETEGSEQKLRETTPQEESVAATEPEKPLQVMCPVSGQEIMPYSVEVLSYNETTRDWRVHDGVDLSAEEGAPVCAAADGKVYAVFEDEGLGNTVVLRHAGGYATCYASLNDQVPVKEGDTVTMGQTIGYAGTTALTETVLGPHVHFSVSYREKPMDPAEFLKLS